MSFNPSQCLFRYVSRSFLRCFLVVLISFFFIAAMLESMEVVRKFSNANIACKTVIELTFLNSVATVSSFFPFTAFLAAILFFIHMNYKLELTAIKVVGISVRQIILCLTFVVALIGVLYLTAIDSFSAFSVDRIKRIETKINNQASNDLTITNSGIWFKDKVKDKSYVIYIKSFSNNFQSLNNARFFEFDKNLNFISSVHAKVATIKDGFWLAQEAKIIDASGQEREVQSFKIPTHFTFSEINKMTTNPKSISFWNISKYIAMLEKVGLSNLRYRVQFFFQLSSILQMIALVLLASIFCINYNNRNTRRYTIKLAIVLALAFPVHFVNNILMALGSAGTIPVIAAAFILPISTIFFCWIALIRK